MKHAFHIPVLGLAFSIDSPLKVAKYGISSVLSVVDDELIERVRHYYAQAHQLPYLAIGKHDEDARAHRITAYLNLVHDLVGEQIQRLKNETFNWSTDLTKYFELLADKNPLKLLYQKMLQSTDENNKQQLQQELREAVEAGSIDINIMSKVDKMNVDKAGNIRPEIFSDALAALRGFAHSKLSSSLILSAGMNPRLYQYLSTFDCFFPNAGGKTQKNIILKVSDYRSAAIQAKYLAKKGIWVAEFRVESGLNCGGHAFATEGLLLGPILEEFKQKKDTLYQELFTLYTAALHEAGKTVPTGMSLRFTVQGGIGTADEQEFLCSHYEFDGTGWGSPFLLVPEATTVDAATLTALTTAKPDDFYLSGASPLGIPFNNFRLSTAEQKRIERIEKGRPGSPCDKKYLVSSKEFGEEPLCTASRAYQHLKLQELALKNLPEKEHEKQYAKIVEKTCLCQGLSTAAYLHYGIQKSRENLAVSICPGPNLAYFDKVYTLKEMVDHIYGRQQIKLRNNRENMFINELKLYVDYLKEYVETTIESAKSTKYIQQFKTELEHGIIYYRSLIDTLAKNSLFQKDGFISALAGEELRLKQLVLPA